ncbi:ArsR/SmtB family transcription factor [Streptomyces sp. BI20]|uniref:ArsR/SmtB family transcription factor n=1 Tax=Streptomyces sp. BI20 TaxID=3403460 RepID=UPI003C7566F4
MPPNDPPTDTPPPDPNTPPPNLPDPSHHPRPVDARNLRGLAHPLRMELLNVLRRHGPATASQLAARLGESSGATSYHLRQLSEYGFIEDAPGQGKGRERWWRAVHGGVAFSDDLMFDPDPTVRGDINLVMHQVADIHTREVAAWLGDSPHWPREWRLASDISDFTLRLTPERNTELINELHAVVERYRAMDPAAPEDMAGAESIRVHVHSFPRPPT